jgi:hypothetical protein
MHYFRRLPPLLRTMSAVGILFGFVVFVAFIFLSALQGLFALQLSWEDVSRIQLVAIDCAVLAIDCAIVIYAYNTRFYRPDREPHPLGSWQRQARAWGSLAVLPLCNIVLALVLSPDLKIYGFVFGLGILGVWIAFGGVCWMTLGMRP